MDFYEAYADIQDGVQKGDLNPNTMSDEALAIYGLGRSDISLSDIPPEVRQSVETKYGLPNFISSVARRETEAFNQMQTGIRQIPGYQKLTDLLTGAQSPPDTMDVGDKLASTLKGLGNTAMGAMGVGFPISNIIAPAAGESLHRALGSPGGDLGRAGFELSAGIAGGFPEAKLMSLLTSNTARKGLQMVPETVQALGTSIEANAPTAGKTLEDVLAGQIGLFKNERPESPAIVEWLRNRVDRFEGTGQFKTTGTQDIVNPDTSDRLKELYAFSRKNLTEDERVWVNSQISDAQREIKTIPKTREVQAPVRVSDIYARGAEPGATISDMGAAQTGLFTKDIPPSPGGITRGGVGVVGEGETGLSRVAPGQLDQAGYQQQLFSDLKRSPVLTKAQDEQKTLDAYHDLMSSQNPGYKPHIMETADDTSMFMKFQNSMIKSTGMLVSGPGTAVRNFLQQGVRYALEVPLKAYQEILTTGSFENAWQKGMAQLSALWESPQMRSSLNEAVSRLPQDVQSTLANRGMMSEYKNLKTPGLYEKTVGVVQNNANKLNELQEKGYWYANFLASINGDLAPYGVKLGRGVTAGQLTEDMLTKATAHANEMTYSRPMGDAAKKMYEWAYKTPGVGLLLNEAVPFARFNFGNAFRDIIDFSPLGFAQASLSKNPEEAARLMAKSLTGTKMIEQAARLKQNDKYDVWELPGANGQAVDTRKWHPMDAYAFFGEIMNRPFGSPNSRVTMQDLAELVTGGTRIEDTAIGILANLHQMSLGSVQEGVMQTLSQMVGRWTTPLKWVDAGVSLVSNRPEQILDRDVMSGKFGIFDRAMANVPGLKELLPERIDPTQQAPPGPAGKLGYIQRQMGLEPVRQTYVKEELKRLKFTGPQGQQTLDRIKQSLSESGIDVSNMEDLKGSNTAGDFIHKMYASTGNKDLNRQINSLMREVGQPALEMFMTSDLYKEMPDPLRRLMADKLIEKLRDATKKVGIAQGGPGMMIDEMFKNMSPTERMVLDYAAR